MLHIMNAICGPRCDQCPAYIATKSQDEHAIRRIAAEWTRDIGRTFTAVDIICEGCRVEGARLSLYCDGCDIRLCALAKGSLTCAHCDEYPCDKIRAPQARHALDEIRTTLNQERR
ncbi:MAG TPA: DUF3795 domain-containing protein [Firmicutes bacterium]|nr:DUF3795 domain-containing protein [Candidatus Fermentithermobacillaceae bacterium]